MEAEEECVLSIATARPGVLVSAPAISPTRLGVSIPTTYLSIKPVRLADPTIRSVSMINVFPSNGRNRRIPDRLYADGENEQYQTEISQFLRNDYSEVPE